MVSTELGQQLQKEVTDRQAARHSISNDEISSRLGLSSEEATVVAEYFNAIPVLIVGVGSIRKRNTSTDYLIRDNGGDLEDLSIKPTGDPRDFHRQNSLTPNGNSADGSIRYLGDVFGIPMFGVPNTGESHDPAAGVVDEASNKARGAQKEFEQWLPKNAVYIGMDGMDQVVVKKKKVLRPRQLVHMIRDGLRKGQDFKLRHLRQGLKENQRVKLFRKGETSEERKSRPFFPVLKTTNITKLTKPSSEPGFKERAQTKEGLREAVHEHLKERNVYDASYLENVTSIAAVSTVDETEIYAESMVTEAITWSLSQLAIKLPADLKARYDELIDNDDIDTDAPGFGGFQRLLTQEDWEQIVANKDSDFQDPELKKLLGKNWEECRYLLACYKIIGVPIWEIQELIVRLALGLSKSTGRVRGQVAERA